TFTIDAQMIEDTPAQYNARMQQHAEKTLGAVAQAAQAAGVACEMVQVEHEHPYQAIIDTAVELTHCFLRLVNLDGGAFERLGRYNAALWKQTAQTLLLLGSTRRR